MDSNQLDDKKKSVIFETVTVDDDAKKNLEPQEIKDEMPEIEQTPDNINIDPVINISGGSSIPKDQKQKTNFFGDIPINKQYFIIGAAVIVSAIIFLFFVNFLTSITTQKKDTVLTYWGLWEDKQVIDPLIADYQRKNPNIKINYMKMDPKDYREKLIQRSRDGQGPDIFRFHNTWLPQIKEITSYIPKNVMTTNEFESTFYPVCKEDLKIGDYIYGIPLEIDGLVLIYNDDLFKKAGITTPPRTWQDVSDYAIRLSAKGPDGKLITAGIALGLTSNVEHYSDIFGWMLLENGLDLKKMNSELGADTLESFVFFRGDDKDSQNKMWDEYMPNSIVAFVEEKVAMIIAPSWQIINIKESNSNLKLKTATLPVNPGGIKVALANYWVEGVSKFSKNQLEAWKFLKFLSEKENMTKLYSEQSKVKLFGEPYSRVDLASTLIQDPYVGAVIEQAQNLKSLPVVWRTYDNGLNDEIIKYIEDAINARINATTPQEALKKAQEGISQVYKKYGVN